MLVAAWPGDTRYRLTLTTALTDQAARPLQLPPGMLDSVEVELGIPADLSAPTGLPREFPLLFDNIHAASSDLDGRFPGGQTLLFQGLWTDPTTGIAYARNRWYDPHNASWLSEDPLGPVDSQNLYAFVGWGPHRAIDPLGLQELTPNSWFTGVQAHLLFTRWIQTTTWYGREQQMGSEIYLNKSIRRIARETPVGQADDSLFQDLFADYSDLMRPDVVSVPSFKRPGELFELKPKAQAASLGEIQVALYIDLLIAKGIDVRAGDFATAVPESAAGVVIPGVVIDFSGTRYGVQVIAPPAGTTPGLVLYELVPLQQGEGATAPAPSFQWAADLQARFSEAIVQQDDFSEQLIPELVGAAGLAALMHQLLGGATISAEAAVPVPVAIINPCVLTPYYPGCGPVIPGA